MKSSRNTKNITQGTALVLLTGMLASTGCSSSSTPAAAGVAPVGVSGSLAAVGTTARIGLPANSHDGSASRIDSMTLASNNLLSSINNGPNSSMLVNYALYHVHCNTSDVPPVEANGTIAADGSFKINVSGALGRPLGCTVLDTTDAVIATFTLNDASKKDMNGNAKVNNSLAFSSADTKLGTVTMNLDTGDVVVPAAQVKDAAGKSALADDASANLVNPFDPTGAWKIADVDFKLPKGTSGTCAGDNRDCNGPPAGAKLYLNRLKGVNVADSKPVYGLQVWQDQTDPRAAMAACGDMTGLAAADAAKAGVDLTSYGTKNGSFTFATSAVINGVTAALTNGYQFSTATAEYTMQACVPKNITLAGKVYHTYVCGPDTAANGSPGGRYQAGLGGGCIDANGKAVSNIDWSQVSFAGTVCTPSASALTGFSKNSCTSRYKGSSLTCTNESGVFDDAALTTPSASQVFNFAGVAAIMTKDQLCSAISNPLAQVNCYANYYQRNSRSLTGCLPQVRTDWSTSDPAAFVKIDFRPNNLVFMEKLSYSDVDNASMLTQQNQNRGVKVQDSSGAEQWISCDVIDRGGLSFKKVNEKTLIAKYVSSTSTTSVDKPACVGASWNGQKSAFLFKLVKQ